LHSLSTEAQQRGEGGRGKSAANKREAGRGFVG